MSKLIMAAAPAALSAETLAAVETARTAMAERDRLLALQRKLTADLAEARRIAGERQAAVGPAEVDVVLAGDPPPAALVKVAEQARAATKQAADIVTRLDYALAAVPDRLLAADEAIEAAAEPMRAQQQASFEAARAAYEFQLRAVVDRLADVLQVGHALNVASGYQLRPHLKGITIPAPFYGDQPMLREGNLLTAADGTTVEIDATWRGNPEALALHELHAPIRATLDTLKLQMDRIRNAREDARLTQRAFGSPPPPPAAPRPPYEPPKGAGPGRSWTTETPVGLPARFGAGGER